MFGESKLSEGVCWLHWSCVLCVVYILKMWFQTFQHELPPNFPSGFLVTAITIIMKNNIFTFGDTHWLQRTGTAMGTPCACMLATIYFSFHERTKILPKYSTNILFYRRYIDDVICLWTNPTDNTLHSNHTYECLKNDMNEFGNLRWEFEPLTLATTFLDLNIKITHPSASKIPYQIHQSISFSTYQKEHNLYLYLPPHSAHPPGITRSLIHGLIRKYWIQNTHSQDFHKMTKLLFQRLLARGHPENTLRSLFLQAAKNIDKNYNCKISPTRNNQTNDTDTNEIFLKWQFHPSDITRKQLQNSYCNTCELRSFSAPQGFRQLHTDHGTTMNINKLTIAYTRDKNLRELLIPSRLPNLPGYTASTLLHLLEQDTQPPTTNTPPPSP